MGRIPELDRIHELDKPLTGRPLPPRPDKDAAGIKLEKPEDPAPIKVFKPDDPIPAKPAAPRPAAPPNAAADLTVRPTPAATLGSSAKSKDTSDTVPGKVDGKAAKATADSIADADAHMKGMRFLYESESEFKDARKKLAFEIAREKLKKQVATQARVDVARKFFIVLAAAVKAAPQALRRLGRLMAAHKKATALSAVAVIAVVAAFSFVPGVLSGVGSKKPGDAPPTTKVITDPEFKTLAPNGDVKSAASGSYAYDQAKKVASYTDKIGTVNVVVSQQQLPDKFLGNPDGELAKFADQIYAKEKLEVGVTTAYIGTSEKGPQTVVFTKDLLLIFISADRELDKSSLFNYIDALK
jgi:hypothetical protein